MRLNKWFWVRVAITAIGGLSGLSITSPSNVESSNVDWPAALLIFLFSIVGLLIVLAVQALNPRSAKVWREPSWEVNPFLFAEPLQFSHCAAYYFLATGTVACATLLYRGTTGAPLAVSLLAVGAGVRIAVRLSAFLFKGKMGTRKVDGDAMSQEGPARL